MSIWAFIRYTDKCSAAYSSTFWWFQPHFGTKICTKFLRKAGAKTRQTNAKNVKRVRTTIFARSLDNIAETNETTHANSDSFPSNDQKRLKRSNINVEQKCFKDQGQYVYCRLLYYTNHCWLLLWHVSLFVQDGESDAPAPDWGELSDAPGDNLGTQGTQSLGELRGNWENLKIFQGLVNVLFWGFWTSLSSICWWLYPQ
jgi:hypothetical protein